MHSTLTYTHNPYPDVVIYETYIEMKERHYAEHVVLLEMQAKEMLELKKSMLLLMYHTEG